MTNGEKLQCIFPNMEWEVKDSTVLTDIDNGSWFNLDWWNAEYKEPTTKNNFAQDRYQDLIEHFGDEKVAKTILESRKEFKAWLERIRWNVKRADELARELEQIKSTTKNDLGVDAISRQAVIEEMEKRHVEGVYITKGFIKELPPVTIRPKGHWIVQPSNKEQGERDFIWWKCSECGQVIFSETEHDRLEYHSFCGRCGAEMEEVVEE